MITSELRIGNLTDKGTVQAIDEAGDTGIEVIKIDYSWCYSEYISPIPLTEEWLLKFGFLKMTDTYELNIGDVSIIISLVPLLIELFAGQYVDGNGFEIKIKYVHQLQNLYFALTGKELLTP